MRIQLENLFQKSCKEGINLFLGSGFSILAKDSNNKKLPLGFELAKEVATEFNIPANIPLQNMATILEATRRKEFHDFLIKRTTVKTFSDEYFGLEKLKIRSVYTTNIDDLIYKIFENSEQYYINDNSINGPTFNDIAAIEYYPLHGSVRNPKNSFVFSSLAIASTFSNSPKLWQDLVRAIEKNPTIFWGYSLNDSGILQTLNSLKQSGTNQKWIVLHEENPTEELYFQSLGFNIIVASNEELLKFINELSVHSDASSWDFYHKTKNFFPKESVPRSSVGLPVREINEFYTGAAPTWSDIYSGAVFKTSHFQKVQDSIFSNKNTIIVGAPASGKTTLLMQVAAFIDFKGHKLVLEYPSIAKARNLITKLNNEPALVFVDNFGDDIEGFLELDEYENINLVGVDREHNYEIISHFINRDHFNIVPVTTLTDNDIQEIFERIPENIKTHQLKKKVSKEDEQPSLFEIINLNINLPSINERFKHVLNELESKDELLTDFLLLSSYVHHCRIPLSFDMAFSYFQQDIGSYREILDLRNQLGSLITDYAGEFIDNDDQDYYAPRSVIVSEAILEQADTKLLRRMLYRFIDTLPRYKIINYYVFKRRGHSKVLLVKAFPDWEEGKHYYERLMSEDSKNPYLLQQGALYLSHKYKFTDAFFWIDKARNLVEDKVFSIRNSYAIILFEANIKREENSVRNTLDSSMEILKKCYLQDKRKLYHAKRFAQQAIEYFEKYGDTVANGYLIEALKWLQEEKKTNDWNRGLQDLIKQINRLIQLSAYGIPSTKA